MNIRPSQIFDLLEINIDVFFKNEYNFEKLLIKFEISKPRKVFCKSFKLSFLWTILLDKSKKYLSLNSVGRCVFSLRLAITIIVVIVAAPPTQLRQARIQIVLSFWPECSSRVAVPLPRWLADSTAVVARAEKHFAVFARLARCPWLALVARTLPVLPVTSDTAGTVSRTPHPPTVPIGHLWGFVFLFPMPVVVVRPPN